MANPVLKVWRNGDREQHHLHPCQPYLFSERDSMKVTQEKLPASKIGLEIEVSPEMSKNAYEQVIREFSRSARIPGFRQGKVPRQVLVQRLGVGRIKAAAIEDLIQSSLEKAIEQEKIEVLGNFQLLSSFEDLLGQFQPGQPLTFSASVDVPPQVEVKDYVGLSLQAEEVKSPPEQVDNFLEERRKEQATLIPVEDRPSQLGDIAVVDYRGEFVSEGESVPIPGGEAEDFQVELLEERFIPGFIQGIVGMNIGDTREIVVNFPEDYASEELAGKEAKFQVELKDLKERELPELDDDFAQAVSEFQTLAELRESIASRYAKQAEDKTKSNKEAALLAELVNHVEVDLPETSIDREIDRMLQQTAIQLSNYGLDIKQLYTQENLPRLREQSRPEAIEKLKQSLGLKEIAQRESIEVSAEEINARLEEIKEQIPENADPQRVRDFLGEELLKEKATDWLLERAQIELVPEGTLSTPEGEEETPETSAPGEEEAVKTESETASES
nr:trigger factor [Oxynema sp. CENA135]